MAPARTARCLAPAKVNLYLDVTGRRADGYHDLETLFAATDWGDDVEVTLRDDGPDVALRVRGPCAAPEGPANLAWRAAAAFREKAGASPAIAIDLEKRVPAGGGLGGGSSDAAAVLRLLDSLLPGRVASDDLARIARALGADVPFFLRGGVAIGRGRGDELAPVAHEPGIELVLILPPLQCETAAVFRAFERGRPAPPGGLAAACAALAARDPAALREAHYNALAFAAMKLNPAFLRFTSQVERLLGRAPAMSGSGATLFDVPDRGEADDVCARLADLPGERLVVRV